MKKTFYILSRCGYIFAQFFARAEYTNNCAKNKLSYNVNTLFHTQKFFTLIKKRRCQLDSLEMNFGCVHNLISAGPLILLN